jgi:hypothetical protein
VLDIRLLLQRKFGGLFAGDLESSGHTDKSTRVGGCVLNYGTVSVMDQAQAIVSERQV